jgi:hypothetical protein
MHISLVYWHIRADMEKDFLHYWENHLRLSSKETLMAEFLCKLDPQQAPFNWQLEKEGGVTYINITIWTSRDAFLRTVPRLSPQPLPFETGLRLRASLTLAAARLGDLPLSHLDDTGLTVD